MSLGLPAFSNQICAAGVLAAALSLLSSGSGRAATFVETLRRVAEAHPQVQSAAINTVAARADVSAARAATLPQVAVTADAGWSRRGLTENSDTAVLPGLRASQLLYDGGRTGAEIRRRKLRTSSLENQEDRVLSDLSERLADAWLEWSRQRALLAISQAQIAALEGLQGNVREIARFDRGREADVALVGTRLAQAVASADSRRVAMTDARALIREIASAPVEPEGDLPEVQALLPGSLEDALALSDRSPAARIADLQVKEAEASVDAARAWWQPQLALEAASDSESSIDGDTKLFGTVALRLRTTLNPIDGGGGSARVRSAQASASAARLDTVYVRQALRDEVARHWALAAERRERLPRLSALVSDTDRSRDIVFEQFRLGRRSVLDLLSFEMERFAARTQLESERRDLIQAQYRLLGALGRIGPALLPGLGAAEAQP